MSRGFWLGAAVLVAVAIVVCAVFMPGMAVVVLGCVGVLVALPGLMRTQPLLLRTPRPAPRGLRAQPALRPPGAGPPLVTPLRI